MTAGLVAVVGPTATGKSDLAVALARELAGEIVNVDSMQLYRGLNIGTAKLPPAERGGVPHHLLDVWDVTRRASVAEYQRLADAAIADVQARGRLPLLVGGSGLYVRAVLDRIEFPGTDPALRARLEAELDEAGAPALHRRLATVDAEAAASILPTNGRRLVRALEVIELTGGPFLARMPEHQPLPGVVQLGLDRPAPDLDARIATRVERMWEQGLVDEVRTLLMHGLRDGPTASRALGYQQVLALLDGECDDAEARDWTTRGTRKFARRQRSWFRRDPRVTWLDAARPDLVTAALEVVRAG